MATERPPSPAAAQGAGLRRQERAAGQASIPISSIWRWKTSSRRSPRPRRSRRRRRPPLRRGNGGSIAARCPPICRAFTRRVAPADTNCPCCQQPMHVIGEETSERLDVIPAQYRVIVTHRPEAGLPGLRADRGSGGAGASDQIRPADRSHGRLGAGGQIWLAPSVVPPSQDAGRPRASISIARRWRSGSAMRRRS